MTTLELFLVHVIFIVACVYFSFRSGEKSGRVQMVEDMIDRGIVKTEDLIDKLNRFFAIFKLLISLQNNPYEKSNSYV